MKHFVALGIALCLLTACFGASACVAYPGVTAVRDAYGGSARVIAHGDEFFNYLTDEQGRLLCYDAYGALRYVVRQGDGYALGGWAGASRLRSSGADGASNKTSYATEKDDAIEPKLRALRATLATGGVAAYSIAPLGASPSTPIPDDYDGNADMDNPLHGNWSADPLNVNQPPRASTCPLLVLKVEFNDVRCMFDDAAWHKRIFDDGVSSYYTAVSDGQFTYTPAPESGGTTNDGVITVRLPIDRPGFDSASGGTQNVGHGVSAGIYTATNGAKYALYNDASLYAYAMLAAQSNINFSTFDRNDDDYISPTELAVLVVVAGYEASYVSKNDGAPMSWAHSWDANNYYNKSTGEERGGTISLHLGGVKLYKYTLIGENVNGNFDYYTTSQTETPVQAQFGTSCHELGHDLGLRDLYDTSYSSQEHHVGYLSLMSQGSWGYAPGNMPGSSPVLLDPYSRIYLGFNSSDTVSDPGAYPVTEASNSAQYNILRVNTDDPDIYYLVENRTQTGYDRGLYGAFNEGDGGNGAIYWRINERIVRANWDANTINNQSGNYGIMPEFLPMPNEWCPFRNAMTYPSQPSLLVRQSRQTIMYCYDPFASRVNVWLGVKKPASIPATGDSATPAAWLAICAACVAAIGGLCWAKRRKKR